MSNLDNINIPNNLREITKDTIKKGIYLKKRKNIKKFKVASLLVLTLSTSLAIINPSLANNRISITDLFEILGYDSYDKYVQSIDTTKTVGDVSLTIGDIICDGSTINFTYTIKSKNKLPRKTSELVFDQLDEPLIRDETFILDSNIKVKNAITSYALEAPKGYIDDYTYESMISYNLNFKDFKVPDSIKVDFSVNSIYLTGENSEKINGPFNFNIKVKPNVKNKVIDVNETKNGITVDSIELSEQSVKVNVSFIEELLDNSNKKFTIYPLDPSITLDSKSTCDILGKSYSETDIQNKNYYTKFGKVYDSIIINNVYSFGEFSDEYIIVNFENFNTGVDNTTKFKIYLDK